ncbi:unnamed protein product, partial [Trichogramma brassicae]
MPCRPGQPPPKPFQWQEEMSFLDNNLFADSCSNMAEEEVKTTRHNSPPSSVQENLSPSRELQVTAKDLSETESEWNFLKSLLFDMNMIAGDKEKHKFRLDAMCLLYNYCLMDPKNDNESGTGASFDDYNDPPLPNNPSIGESSLFNFNRNPFNSSLQDPEKKFNAMSKALSMNLRKDVVCTSLSSLLTLTSMGIDSASSITTAQLGEQRMHGSLFSAGREIDVHTYRPTHVCDIYIQRSTRVYIPRFGFHPVPPVSRGGIRITRASDDICVIKSFLDGVRDIVKEVIRKKSSVTLLDKQVGKD